MRAKCSHELEMTLQKIVRRQRDHTLWLDSQTLQAERDELLRKMRELERKLSDCRDEPERREGEAHELKKSLSAAQTQAAAYADSLQATFPH